MFKRWGGRNPIRELKLSCPDCDYSLEGHSGYAVTCPECGAMCDVRSMVDPHGGMRWTEVPGASDLLAPLWWLAGALVIALPVYGLWRGADAAAIGVILGALIVPAGWLFLCVRGVRRFGGGRGIVYLALLHLSSVAVLAGGIGAMAVLAVLLVVPLSVEPASTPSGLGIVFGMLLLACVFVALVPIGLMGVAHTGRMMVRAYRREYLSGRSAI